MRHIRRIHRCAAARPAKSARSNGGGVNSGGPLPPQPAIDPGAVPDQKTGKVPPLIKRFDKDGDGKLNAQEKAAAQAELKKSKSKPGKDKDGKDKDKDKEKADATDKVEKDKDK